MKKLSFIFSISILFVSCWTEQWEDRVADGDTGSVTHGKYTPPDTSISKINYPDGKILFKTWCASCHNASSKRSTGPGFQGVLTRIPNLEWAGAFVQNEDSVVKSGDAYTVTLRKEYNDILWKHNFKNLSKDEIIQILVYCDAASDTKVVH